MILKDVLNNVEVVKTIGDFDININSIEYDSRKVKDDSIFVCIEGYKTDGHKYITQAIKNGAKCIVSQKELEEDIDVTLVVVKNTRAVMAKLASNLYDNPSRKMKVVGVTGTKGKTTTTYMLKSILEQVDSNVGLIGTIENSYGNKVIPSERTTPESSDLQGLFAQMVDLESKYAVMEVSSHAIELNRVDEVKFDVGIYTNLGRDHLDFHKTFDNYIDAKIKLFEKCKKGLINIDCEYAERVLQNAKSELYTFGIKNKADIMAKDIKRFRDRVEFNVETPWGNGEIIVNIPGYFSVYNALTSIGASLILGIAFRDIQVGLKKAKVPGRAEVVDIGKEFTVMIDYAHTPDSLENILNTVKDFSKGKVISVFGCGGDRDKTKRPIMGKISGEIADFSVITSDNPRTEAPNSIINEIVEGINESKGAYITIEDRREAIKYALTKAEKEDVIVISGKGHETYQIFREKTIDFDERKVVESLNKEIFNKK